MNLPGSVQDVADILGRERALYLVGQLPKSAGKNRYGERAWLYVPKRLKPDHILVCLLGWQDAQKMVREFSGIILELSTCNHVYRDFRNKAILRLRTNGMKPQAIAVMMDLTVEAVRKILREMLPEETRVVGRNNDATISFFGFPAHEQNEQKASR